MIGKTKKEKQDKEYLPCKTVTGNSNGDEIVWWIFFTKMFEEIISRFGITAGRSDVHCKYNFSDEGQRVDSIPVDVLHSLKVMQRGRVRGIGRGCHSNDGRRV